MVQKGHTYFLNPDTDLRSRLFKYVRPFVTTIHMKVLRNIIFLKKETRAHIAYYVWIVNVL